MGETAGHRAERYRAESAAPADTSYLDAEAAAPADSLEEDTRAHAPRPLTAQDAEAVLAANTHPDVEQERIKHIADQIRAAYAKDYDLSGATDAQVLAGHRQLHPDMPEPDYIKKRDEVYGADFKPSLLGRVRSFNEGAKTVLTDFAPYIIQGASHLIKPIAHDIPVASQVGFGLGHETNQLVDAATARNITRQEPKLPNVDDLTAQYFAHLQPGLKAQGFSDSDIMGEAKRRAQNVYRGAADTIDSMEQDVDVAQRAAVNELPAGITDALFMGADNPMVNKALAKVGLGYAEKAVTETAAQAATKPGALASLWKHAGTAALIGGTAMGAGGATRAGFEAAAENMSPAEIAKAAVQGGWQAFKEGGKYGLMLGGGIGAAGVVAGKATEAIEKARAAKQAVIDAADKARLEHLAAADAEARGMIAEERAARIKGTADAFDPITSRYPVDQDDPYRSARMIVAQEHGEDAARTEAGLNAVDTIAQKIKVSLAAQADALTFGNRDLGPANRPQPGAPGMTQPGTLAGQGGTGATMPIRPGDPNLLRMEGQPAPAPGMNELQQPPIARPTGVPGPAQEPRPMLPGPEQRIEQPVHTPQLGVPTGTPFNQFQPAFDAGVGNAIEHVPGTLRPATEFPGEQPRAERPRDVNPLAQHVVETYKHENKFVDKADRDMHPPLDKEHARAIAQEYENLKNAAPGSPEFAKAKASYDALNAEVAKQFRAIKAAGYKISFVTEDPYKNSAEMRADVRDNHHLAVLLPEEGHHPFMTTKETAIFRAVHDFFGHAAEGYEFGPRGEEAAFRQHAATLSNDAIPALASETRGQNSWVNFMPENEKLPAKERPFAEQKFALMPEHTYADVLHETKPTEPANTSAPKPVVGERSEPVAPAAGSSPEPREDQFLRHEDFEDAHMAWERGKNAEPAATPAPEPTPAPGAQISTDVQHALSTLNLEGHAKVVPSPEGGLHIERLGQEGGPPPTAGRLNSVLDDITAAADAHNLPVTARLTKIDSNGGKIPIEKQLKAHFEPRGFTVTNSTKIPEGQMTTADIRREPNGTQGQDLMAKLQQSADEARKRIIKRRLMKGDNMHGGAAFDQNDLAQLKDHALVLAADMFTKGLKTRNAIKAWAIEKWGGEIQPVIDHIVDEAQKHFARMFKDSATADKKLKELIALKDSGNYGLDWYKNTADWAQTRFGKRADTFLRFLAVTSANGQTESGAALALKAMAQYEAGLPFENFRGPEMVGQLKTVARGEALPPDTKIKNFYDALRGGENAVVLDRWMMDAVNMKDTGGALPPNKYRIYEAAVRQLAADNNMTPRQFQAAVWEGARVRTALTKEAIGGRAMSSKIGSARPLEELVDRKLGGMSFDEYAKTIAGDMKSMHNLGSALRPVREALGPPKTGFKLLNEDPAVTGHTFNPEDFSQAKHAGNTVTLISHNVSRQDLYPTNVLKFKERVKPLIAEMEAAGLKPTLGVFRLDDQPGKFSIDLNIMVDDENKARELGRLNRQIAYAKLGEGGQWQANVDTGYDPKTDGKPFKPPHDWKDQDAWYKQQINRVRAFVKRAGLKENR